MKAAVLTSSHKDDLIQEINSKLDNKTTSVHMSIRPTINILAAILTAAPSVKTITCPPSLYELTPKKIHSALKKVNINFESLMLNPGRPRSHPKWKLDKVYKLHLEGISVKEIAKELDIPLTTIYYYLNKSKGD